MDGVKWSFRISSKYFACVLWLSVKVFLPVTLCKFYSCMCSIDGNKPRLTQYNRQQSTYWSVSEPSVKHRTCVSSFSHYLISYSSFNRLVKQSVTKAVWSKEIRGDYSPVRLKYK